jgi:hypothetical protein
MRDHSHARAHACSPRFCSVRAGRQPAGMALVGLRAQCSSDHVT